MVHKINIFLSAVATAVIMCLCAPINAICRTHVYTVPLFLVGLFAACYLVIFIVFWLFCGAVSLTINTKKTYTKQSKFYAYLFSLLMEYATQIASAKITITGMEKLPPRNGQKFLFVSNHKSTFDTLLQVGAFRGYTMAFISKPENFSIPLGHRFMTRCRYMAIDRSDVRSGAKITKLAADMIKSGDCSVGVYPEGTRNKTEDILIEFKHGCFKSAVWAQAPIVIGVAHNTAEIHKHFPFGKRTPVHFEIVETIPYEKYKGWNTQEISDYVRNRMLERLT